MRISNAASKICILTAILISFASAAYAAGTTNVSILYAWNGSEFKPLELDSAGRLKTNINLTKSFGIYPNDDNAYDIGRSNLRWKSGYFVNVIVDGNLTFTGSLGLNVSSLSSNGSVTIGQNLTVDTADNVLIVDSTNNRVGIMQTTPNATLGVSGRIEVSGDINVTGSLIVGGSNITAFTNISVLHAYNRSGGNFVPLSVTSSGALELSVVDERGAQTLRSGASGTDLSLISGLVVDTSTFYINATSNMVGIGTIL